MLKTKPFETFEEVLLKASNFLNTSSLHHSHCLAFSWFCCYTSGLMKVAPFGKLSISVLQTASFLVCTHYTDALVFFLNCIHYTQTCRKACAWVHHFCIHIKHTKWWSDRPPNPTCPSNDLLLSPARVLSFQWASVISGFVQVTPLDLIRPTDLEESTNKGDN